MKKLLYVFISLVCLLTIGLLLLWGNLPAVGSYVLSRLAGGTVEIGSFAFSYQKGILYLDIKDIRAEGKVTGNAKDLKVAINPRKGLYFNHVALSDFSVTIPKQKKGKAKFSIIPTDLLEARNGVITYGTEKFTIKALTAEHLRKGKPFRFRGEIENDRWFAALMVDGEGLVKGKNGAVKGTASVKGLDMGQWTEDMAGFVDGAGTFAYEKNRLSLEASFAVSGYELRIEELKDPRFHETLRGTATLSYEKNVLRVHVPEVIFKDAPFRVDVELTDLDVSRVEVSSGLLDVKEFKHYVDLDKIEKGASSLWDYVKGGRVAIKRISYIAAGRHSDVDLVVKDLYGSYKTWQISAMEGAVHIDNKSVSATGVKGTWEDSSFRDVTASYAFSSKKMKVDGSYTVNLKDVAPMVKRDDFSLSQGLSSGSFSVEAQEGGAMAYRGNGVMTGGGAIWKTLPFSFKGAYSFARTGISFEPLEVTREGTDLTITGSWSPDRMGFRIKGPLEAAHVEHILPLPVKTGGMAFIDVGIEEKDLMYKVHGAIDMKDLSYEVPGVMTKNRGFANTANFDISEEKDLLHLTRLTYNLGPIDADIKGDIRKNRIMDLDVALKVDGFEKVAPLFATTETVARGDAEAVMSLKGVDLQTKKVSFAKGYINVNNGFFKIPGLGKPLKEVKLQANFTGDAFAVRVDRFICGASTMRAGSLHAEGLQAPRFALALDMESLDMDDFQSDSEFKARPLKPDSPFGRAKGTLTMKAGAVKLGALKGRNLTIEGTMDERKVTVKELKMDTLGGHAAFSGAVDLSGLSPAFSVNGKLDNITSKEVLTALDSEAQVVKGTWFAQGNLSTHGRTKEEMIAGVNGTLHLYSENGVIKRWNLLSKVLGLLNVYELVRGKVDLGAEGLPYERMGATFNAREGVFRTDNFIIDSPAMVLTGSGDIYTGKNEIDGNIIVSPLVTIDSIFDRIPLLGRIFGKKKGGFLYVSYEVKGPLQDPDVRVKFVDTIGGRALEIIKGVLTLPKEVFQ
ncbi:MAG TPA: AsmA-like C-terminal domain-containing protein [Syntrophorhabdaceae bacterium]|jgi:hypothetical protein